MNGQQNYFKPAIIGGLASGLLSVIPIISAGNCVCCLWVVVGGVLAVYFLAEQNQGKISPGGGALAGLLSGLVGACIVTIVLSVSIPFLGLRMLRHQMDQMRRIPGMPGGIEQFYGHFLNGRFVILTIIIAVLIVSGILFSIFGTLGGLLGSALFAKKQQTLQAPPPLPPPAPPVA